MGEDLQLRFHLRRCCRSPLCSNNFWLASRPKGRKGSRNYCRQEGKEARKEAKEGGQEGTQGRKEGEKGKEGKKQGQEQGKEGRKGKEQGKEGKEELKNFDTGAHGF